MGVLWKVKTIMKIPNFSISSKQIQYGPVPPATFVASQGCHVWIVKVKMVDGVLI